MFEPTPPAQPPESHSNGRRRPSRKLVIGVVLAALVLVFVLQNTRRGRINVFLWHASLPASIWLLAIFIVGVIVGSIFPWLRRPKRRPKKAQPSD